MDRIWITINRLICKAVDWVRGATGRCGVNVLENRSGNAGNSMYLPSQSQVNSKCHAKTKAKAIPVPVASCKLQVAGCRLLAGCYLLLAGGSSNRCQVLPVGIALIRNYNGLHIWLSVSSVKIYKCTNIENCSKKREKRTEIEGEEEVEYNNHNKLHPEKSINTPQTVAKLF